MKSVNISGILFIVMAAYVVIPAVPVIDYLINKDYIAKNLCVNRDKPKSCCKGKCHMVKQLQKATQNPEKDTKNTNTRLQVKELNEFVVENINHFIPYLFSVKLLIDNPLAYSKVVCAAIFVPPKSVI